MIRSESNSDAFFEKLMIWREEETVRLSRKDNLRNLDQIMSRETYIIWVDKQVV